MNIFNDEKYLTTASEFENMTYHNKVLYLQSKRSSFVSIPIHQYLQEDTHQFRKKRRLCANAAYHEAESFLKNSFNYKLVSISDRSSQA